MEQSNDKARDDSNLIKTRKQAIEAVYDQLVQDNLISKQSNAAKKEAVRSSEYTIGSSSFARLRPG